MDSKCWASNILSPSVPVEACEKGSDPAISSYPIRFSTAQDCGHSAFFDDPDVGTEGLVVHVNVAHPFCQDLSAICSRAVEQAGATVHMGGNFVTIEGPRFSTRAESLAFRQLGYGYYRHDHDPGGFPRQGG